jgi:hypothetical protein
MYVGIGRRVARASSAANSCPGCSPLSSHYGAGTVQGLHCIPVVEMGNVLLRLRRDVGAENEQGNGQIRPSGCWYLNPS